MGLHVISCDTFQSVFNFFPRRHATCQESQRKKDNKNIPHFLMMIMILKIQDAYIKLIICLRPAGCIEEVNDHLSVEASG
jgi:hypothetical protein